MKLFNLNNEKIEATIIMDSIQSIRQEEFKQIRENRQQLIESKIRGNPKQSNMV